jgi:hypothetical protein
MKGRSNSRHLRLIHGGEAGMGPFERLDLADRIRRLSPTQITILIVSKLILLSSVLYCIYR